MKYVHFVDMLEFYLFWAMFYYGSLKFFYLFIFCTGLFYAPPKFFFVVYIFFIVFAIWYFLMPKDMDDFLQV